MADEESKYLNSIRHQPCHACGSPLFVEPHHSTVGSGLPWECAKGRLDPQRREQAKLPGKRGKSQRAHDSWAFPLCAKCHRQFHDATGRFADWDAKQRREWQDAAVAEYRGAWLDEALF